MPLDDIDRVALNREIERLIETQGADEEARSAISRFGSELRSSKAVQLLGKIHKPGGTVSGQTPQHGQVSISDDQPQTKEFERGVERERVGYYKVWRDRMRGEHWITIADFWKADMGTESEVEGARHWVLALDDARTPVWFGERGTVDMFRIPLGFGYIRVQRHIFVESWGAAVGARHPGGFVVGIVIGRE